MSARLNGSVHCCYENSIYQYVTLDNKYVKVNGYCIIRVQLVEFNQSHGNVVWNGTSRVTVRLLLSRTKEQVMANRRLFSIDRYKHPIVS